MSPTLFRSRRRPSHGRRPRRRCVRASPRLPADQSLRRAPARSGTLCLSRERIRTARRYGACFASKLCLINCAAFPQGQQTVVRRPHPKDPREAPPCPMLSHDRVGVASGFCSICSYILFAHTIPSEISLARSILATRHWRFSALLPKTGRRRHDEQTLCRRTSRAPTKQASPLAHQLSLGHLLPSEGARAACRSCHVARPPPARFRGRGPDARIVCFFSARLLVGSRSLAPASRAARPRRSFSRRRLAGGSCHHRDPSVPSRRGSLRGRRRRPEPRGAGRLSRASDGFFDRASSFPCRIVVPAFVRLLSRRSRIDARRAGRFRRSCTRTRGRGLFAALERERRTPGPSARPSSLFRSAKYPAPGANYLSSFSRVGALFP